MSKDVGARGWAGEPLCFIWRFRPPNLMPVLDSYLFEVAYFEVAYWHHVVLAAKKRQEEAEKLPRPAPKRYALPAERLALDRYLASY